MKEKIKAWVIKQRNKLGNWLFKLAKRVYVAEKKPKFTRKKPLGRTFCVLLIVGVLAGCGTKQTPVQQTINYTDNRQITQVAGDGNQLAATSDVQADQSAVPEQTTETKSGGGFWLFMFGLLCGLGAAAAGVVGYLYFTKWRK